MAPPLRCAAMAPFVTAFPRKSFLDCRCKTLQHRAIHLRRIYNSEIAALQEARFARPREQRCLKGTECCGAWPFRHVKQSQAALLKAPHIPRGTPDAPQMSQAKIGFQLSPACRSPRARRASIRQQSAVDSPWASLPARGRSRWRTPLSGYSGLKGACLRVSQRQSLSFGSRSRVLRGRAAESAS
jgi:hypothetical protein